MIYLEKLICGEPQHKRNAVSLMGSKETQASSSESMSVNYKKGLSHLDQCCLTLNYFC